VQSAVTDDAAHLSNADYLRAVDGYKTRTFVQHIPTASNSFAYSTSRARRSPVHIRRDPQKYLDRSEVHFQAKLPTRLAAALPVHDFVVFAALDPSGSLSVSLSAFLD
jgi:hypothetical protein